VKSSILSVVLATIFSLFGTHTNDSQNYAAHLAAVAASSPPVHRYAPARPTVLAASTTSPQVQTSTVIKSIAEQSAPAPTIAVSQEEFKTALQQLDNKLSSQLASVSASIGGVASNYTPIIPFAQSQRIDQLQNVAISNATVNGVSGLTESDIPSLSDKYLSVSGGALAFASSTQFSVFSNAYFGATATSSFDSTGALTLATPLLVTSGGTGWSALAGGSIPFGNGSSALATSSSLFWDNTNSRLGIGTSSPLSILDVQGSSNNTSLTVFDGNRALSISNIDTTDNNAESITFRTNDLAGLLTTAVKLAAVNVTHAANAVSGDLAFLTRNSGTLTEKARLTGFGNFGIGTSAPASLLAVSGGASVGADYNSPAPSNGLIVEGQLGVGTSSPTSGVNLDVVSQDAGTILRVATENPTAARFPSFFIDNYKGSFTGGGQILYRNWSGSISSPSAMLSGAGLGQIGFTGYAGNANPLVTDTAVLISASTDEGYSSTNAGAHLSFATTPLGGSSLGVNRVEWMRITPNGAVGINTTAPAFQLDVKGFGRISTTVFTGTGLNDGTSAGTYTGTDISAVTYTVIIDGNGTPDTFKWQKGSGSFTTSVNITGGNQTLTDGVQIKFAATTGHTIGDQWVITATPVSSFGAQNAAGTRTLAVANNGTVGIGTTSPDSLLEVSASNANTTLTTFGDPAISVTNRSTTNNSFANVVFKTQSTSGASSTIARLSGIATSHTNGAVSGNLAFLLNNAGTVSEVARFNSSGQLGLGTTSPYAQLSIFAGGDYASHAASTLFAIASSSAGSATSTLLVVNSAGNVGIATTSPWRTLDVNGTVGFKGLTTDSADSKTLCLTANNEVVANTGSTCITSSERFKNSITPLDSSSGLTELLKLNPVSFEYNSDIGVPGTQVGFIAEQVQQVDPRLVVVDASGTPFTVRYENLTAILAKSIQEIASVAGPFKDTLVTWLGNSANGIADLFANNVYAHNNLYASNQLCIGQTCVTEAQLKALLAQAGQAPSAPLVNSSTASTISSSSLPVIAISGDNPAIIHIGDTYSDLGATITGPQADLNLGIATFVNGAAMTPVLVDTSQAATDTIDYVVSDQNGLTSTSTRTVLVQAPTGQTTSTDASTTDSQ
jgi:hypothetical protein